jgi:hypothetical protein
MIWYLPFKAPDVCSAKWDNLAWLNWFLHCGLERKRVFRTREITLSLQYQNRAWPSIDRSVYLLKKLQRKQGKVC